MPKRSVNRGKPCKTPKLRSGWESPSAQWYGVNTVRRHSWCRTRRRTGIFVCARGWICSASNRRPKAFLTPYQLILLCQHPGFGVGTGCLCPALRLERGPSGTDRHRRLGRSVVRHGVVRQNPWLRNCTDSGWTVERNNACARRAKALNLTITRGRSSRAPP